MARDGDRPEPGRVALARAHGVEAYEGDARYLQLPGEGFDLALALDVLEHIEDDGARPAAELARVLRPGGTALVSVASDMALWSARDVAAGRVRRYGRRALVELLEGAGLLVERVWSRGVLVRPVPRLLRHRMSRCDDLAPLHPALNGALRVSAVVERRLPVRSLPGTCLFARARRPG
ncbi:class I SAM-dependent methyltransferase [Actinomadura sp. CNU-125]|uniref:class I SAM-dependent methyltransferase n=1 Tax=Actinomadura sp. CNU-125 TaxID=1904961 RepID=UPI0021CC98B8|nr:class I SAM-dependent methyltransferase [Actinomadura sp. CNU-125]